MDAGRILDLTVERPVAGGRMLARFEGAVVFVGPAIPGERVRARVTRTSRHAVWADVIELIEASPARRTPPADPSCGGLSYAHIRYDQQLRLKGEIVADAFRRMAGQRLEPPPIVAASPEHGYRMRARLHVRGRRAGFFREGTHEICDAAATGQLLPESLDVLDRWLRSLGDRAGAIDAVSVVENVPASDRVLHVELAARAGPADLGTVELLPGVTGVSVQAGSRVIRLAGSRSVSDSAADLFRGESPIDDAVRWTRRATSFFQGNRFLTGTLVRRVLDLASGERVVDLYAGVGLFAVALAAGGAQVLAVESDASSGADLDANARPFGDRLHVERTPVESAVRARLDPPPHAVVVDPPRTGLSVAALAGIAAWRAPRIVYVSCDPPTLGRDAARLAAADYALESLEGVDLFPNTAHVETVARFVRSV